MSVTIYDARLACTTDRHLLATVNPWAGDVWCVCGKVRVPGMDHVVHRERFVYDGAGQGARLLGFERYRLGSCTCHPRGIA